MRSAVLLLLLLLLLIPSQAAAAMQPLAPRHSKYVPGELLVKYREDEGERVRGMLKAKRMVPLERFERVGVERLLLPAAMSVEEAVEHLRSAPGIEFVEPNYIRRASTLPNDPLFGQQWGLRNTGQTINGVRGRVNADIDAVRAWSIETGAGVVIAVLDTGVAHNHPELAPNIWDNPHEARDGTDTSGNGLVDDTQGWDFVDNDNDPMDPNGHGTYVAGVIAAQGDNGMGMAGVCWNARIIPVRFLNAFGEGRVSDEIEAINYAVAMGARVINASYGSQGFSRAEYEAIREAGLQGVLFVAAAGNRGADNDLSPEYPASYDLDNIISVAATTQRDRLSEFSNFGRFTVDVGAPGENIVTTSPRRVELLRFDFEGGDAPGWALDPPWEVTGGRGFEGDFSLGAQVGERLLDASATTPELDLAGQSGAMLHFALQRTLSTGSLLLVEASRSAAGPWERVPVSVGGPSWGVLFKEGITGSSPEWFEARADLGRFDGEAAVNARFRLISAASLSAQEVFLDDVALVTAGDHQSYSGERDDFVFVRGTSFSAAFVSGLAGLILSHEPDLSPAEVRERIINTVDRPHALSGILVSEGRVNAYQSIQNISPHGARDQDSPGGGCVLAEGELLPGVEWWMLVAALLLWAKAGRGVGPAQKGRWKKQRL
jgi:subtilisin family serine protease